MHRPARRPTFVVALLAVICLGLAALPASAAMTSTFALSGSHFDLGSGRSVDLTVASQNGSSVALTYSTAGLTDGSGYNHNQVCQQEAGTGRWFCSYGGSGPLTAPNFLGSEYVEVLFYNAAGQQVGGELLGNSGVPAGVLGGPPLPTFGAQTLALVYPGPLTVWVDADRLGSGSHHLGRVQVGTVATTG